MGMKNLARFAIFPAAVSKEVLRTALLRTPGASALVMSHRRHLVGQLVNYREVPPSSVPKPNLDGPKLPPVT
jgi:hypothetical protein